MMMDAWQQECYERSAKFTAPCSLCNDGKVKIFYFYNEYNKPMGNV